MVEIAQNRPEGAREDDFSELNDWTITDIATSPNTAPEDRKNAEAEIEKREEAGNYNPDDAAQEVRTDLLSHGYGVEDGKIMYPKEGYKEWLNSDKSQPFSGVARETINDRLEAELAEQEKINELERQEAEQIQKLNRTIGETAMKAFEDAPTREKISHPEKKSRRIEINREREDEQRDKDNEYFERRKFKEKNKYEDGYLDPKKSNKAKIRTNLPNFEVTEAKEEKEKDPESPEERAEKLYNYYEDNFKKDGETWATYGVSSLLEKGIVNPSADSMLRSGFWSHEEEKVHDKIDPENTFSEDAIDAEASLKTRVSRDLIGERFEELSSEELEKAKYDGTVFAIYSGARVDDRTGKVIYSFPVEQGDKIIEAIKPKTDDSLEYEGGAASARAEQVQKKSYNGFINIVDAIKGKRDEKEKGFKTLDWYFDTFGYNRHMDEFMGNMDACLEVGDKAFNDTFSEYLEHRKEYENWLDKQKNSQERDLASLADAEPVSKDELMQFIGDRMKESESVEIFGVKDTNVKTDRGGESGRKAKYSHPSSVEKCTKAMLEIQKVIDIDPNATFSIGTIFDDEKKKPEKDYVILRFGYNGFNNVIAMHIGNKSKAIFVWRGKTGENAEGWRDYFRNTSIRDRDPEVKRLTAYGYAKEKYVAIDRQYERAWAYLNSPEKTETA